MDDDDLSDEVDLMVGEEESVKEPTPIVNKTTKELDAEIVDFLMNEIAGLFSMIDVDGDGKIGLMELQSFFRAEGKHLTFEEADIILHEMGFDGDGYIQFNEFSYIMYDELRDTTTDDMLADVFDMIDTDNDGYLSIIDVSELYRRLGINLTPTEATDLMKNCDTSKDGLVDFEEFKAYFRRTNKYLQLLEQREEQVKREAEEAEDEENGISNIKVDSTTKVGTSSAPGI